MPWKENKNVFHIWLSEIILQQTRVEQGIPYFIKFKERFKNVSQLAEASDEEVMRLWQGLGYYSRARNLHAAAKQVAENNGVFPNTYEGLLQLKGVGPYTAAAIASFAYDFPVPVMDGNVIRVIARIFGISEPIDTSLGLSKVKEILHKIFDAQKPAAFNQAIMDFGAIHCTPKNPNCQQCPFAFECMAYTNDMIAEIPYKSKKIKKRTRYFQYFIIASGGYLIIKKRKEKDIWKHLHDFPLIESKNLPQKAIDSFFSTFFPNTPYEFIASSEVFKHVLTHQDLYVSFHHFKTDQVYLEKGSEYFLVEPKNLPKFAFPKIIDWYFENKSIYLK